MSRLDEIKWRLGHTLMLTGRQNGKSLFGNDLDWLIQQAERTEDSENRNKQLEYASMHNGELNEFLQKRKLPPNTLGRHVVDVVMDYVEELEQDLKMANEAIKISNDSSLSNFILEDQNQRYKQALEFYAGIRNYHSELWKNTAIEDDCGRIARRTLADNHD